MSLILCVGFDSAQVTSRKMLLERAGHRVVAAFDEPSITAACQQSVFDLAVIGHGGPIEETKRFCKIIRQHCPAAKVLELYGKYFHTVLHDVDIHFDVDSGPPSDLVERVDALLARTGTQRR